MTLWELLILLEPQFSFLCNGEHPLQGGAGVVWGLKADNVHGDSGVPEAKAGGNACISWDTQAGGLGYSSPEPLRGGLDVLSSVGISEAGPCRFPSVTGCTSGSPAPFLLFSLDTEELSLGGRDAGLAVNAPASHVGSLPSSGSCLQLPVNTDPVRTLVIGLQSLTRRPGLDS